MKPTHQSTCHYVAVYFSQAVMFVIDPSGFSGEKSTLHAQLRVREQIRGQFPRRPWIDVVSKGDLPIAEEDLVRLPKDHLLVSVKSGLNMDVLRDRIETILLDLETFLKSSMEDELEKAQAVDIEEDGEEELVAVDNSFHDDDVDLNDRER